ncbi:Radical SAM domain protein [Desulfatibacillum aliphaticivorans]|uniref:Radical SAM domain protein n=1 Tax=Desulfatibacillum aliphaticivorans TaxID=218208 RepID=B8F966_DESAL|nr:radical SAM protein [Desulfatibacillum aliphaticivorans]ACL02812.1 Radical SAM domain protein [Desulfatibacillum aliphaticivorans]
MAQSQKEARKSKAETYNGFEQGPIRPPSEARSLLIRVSRNCPWNRCTFCPVYKGSQFSLRSKDHVIEDIEAVHRYLERILPMLEKQDRITHQELQEAVRTVNPQDPVAYQAAINWINYGMESIFLQDANSLIIKPKDLIEILRHLRRRFPWTKRITSYARSHTIARISLEDLTAMAEAGLNRIHIGMESGSDKVLKRVKKGVDKATHVKAGRLVKDAGMELSEYVMPGLGGRDLSEDHALETADALNRINADFIRIRSLALPPNAPIYQEHQEGNFDLLTGVETAKELLLFLETLDGITSYLKSDHILNLFETLEGRYPRDKEKMTAQVKDFLVLPPDEQVLYQVGRRAGIFRGLEDMKDPGQLSQAQGVVNRLGANPENVDSIIYELMQRFV